MGRLKNRKLLTEQALRDDLYVEFMYTAGSIAMYRRLGELDTENVRKIIEEQIDLLVPVIKRHIKRHVRDTTNKLDVKE